MPDDDVPGPTPDWAVIAVLAGLDLAVRGWDTLLAVFSLAGGYVAPAWLSVVTTWALFGALFYRACPVAYTPLSDVPATAPWFRAAFAATAVAVGLVLQFLPSGPVLVASLLAVVLASGAFVLWLLARKRAWRVFDPDGRGVAVLNDISPNEDISDEVERDLSRTGALGAAGATAYVVALVLVLAVPSFLAAVVAQILQYAFPLPDLAVLAWPIVNAVATGPEGSGSGDGETHDDDNDDNDDDDAAVWFDVEGVLVDVMETGIHSVQGLFLTMFVLLGGFEAAGFLYLGSLAAKTVTPLVETVFVAEPVTRDGAVMAWNALGTVAVLGFTGLFVFRSWTLEFRRVQVFLEDWAAAADGSPATARLGGSLWLPVAAAWLVRTSVQSLSTPGSTRQWLLAGLWPLLVCVGGWFVWRRRGERSTAGENYWILAAFVAHTLALWLVVWRPDQSVLAHPGLFLSVPVWVAAVTVVLTVLPVASRRDDAGDRTGYATVLLLVALGCLAVGTASVLAFPQEGVARLLGAWSLLSALALGIVRYFGL